MLNVNSAAERKETPHSINSNQNDASGFNRCIAIAYSRRAESVIKDASVDAQTRFVIRYALETADPWLPELLRRVDAGESLFDATDLTQDLPAISDEDCQNNNLELELEQEKVEALTDMICRDGDEPDTKSAALLVLMSTLERSRHPKVLANTAKHLAFNHCADRNLYGMVDAETRLLEAELFAGNLFWA